MSHEWSDAELTSTEAQVTALEAVSPQPLTGDSKVEATNLKQSIRAKGWSNLTSDASVGRIKAIEKRLEALA